MSATLYDKDFYQWALEQAHYIKTKAFDKLDIEHLFEEVESMGKREKRELDSRLTVLLMHLLKWKYQPTYINKNSWKRTIKEQRLEVDDVLIDNPSLKPLINNYLYNSYQKAILKAANETGLDESIFPQACEWSVEQILDNEFYP